MWGGSFSYPKDYSQIERKILKQYFYSSEEYDYLIDLKRTKGLKCYAGVDMINIFLNGIVRRCFTGQLGIEHKINNEFHHYIKNNLKKKIFNQLQKSFFNSSFKKLNTYFTNETSLNNIISGKINLISEPYPCHENICPCNAHFIGLKKFREKYKLSDIFIDSYELN